MDGYLFFLYHYFYHTDTDISEQHRIHPLILRVSLFSTSPF